MASMEGLIAGPMAEALRQGRDRFNTRFAYARRSSPSLDQEAFAEHLRSVVRPIADAVFRVAPDKVYETVEALYDISLELVAKGFLGKEIRYPALLAGWTRLFVELPHLLASGPALFAGPVSNALYNLSVTAGARPAYWIDAMIGIGRNCSDVRDFLEAGKAVAWRSGMAHYREGALEACRNLSPEIARAALSIPDSNTGDLSAILDELAADPWLAPAVAARGEQANRRLKIVSAVGGFRGFGGFFRRPPEVVEIDGEIVASDGEEMWVIVADIFGATLHRAGSGLPARKTRGAPAFKIDKSGKVTKEASTAVFSELASPSSSASNHHTLAVTIPLSHAVYLVAMTSS
ncbi:MAG TPA: hypothetical protein VNO14_15845 [Blastocatellia bacterium]|nr:hypothetical protein [Blastocatellia bacterium]